MRLPISPHSHDFFLRPPFGDLCWNNSRTGHNRSGLARPFRLWGAPLKGPATTLYNVFGGTDGARTRDLWRDRPALSPSELQSQNLSKRITQTGGGAGFEPAYSVSAMRIAILRHSPNRSANHPSNLRYSKMEPSSGVEPVSPAL